MQNHWKSPNSPHKILLSSLKGDFILQKRSLPNEELQIQIYQNEVHIKDLSPSSFRRNTPPDEVFQRIFNELTNKARLYKIKNFDKLSLSFSSCESMTESSLRYLRKILIQNFSGIKSLALNFFQKEDNFSENVVGLLAEFISNFKDLRSLQIRLVAFCEISDSAMKFLIKQIHTSQRYLKNLHIDISARLDSFDSHNAPPKQDLFERLAQRDNTESYSSKQNCLSEDGILRVNYSITKYFNTLQKLNLNFCDSLNNKISDRVCQELGQRILERMDRLKRLSLNFCGCEDLTNEAMRLFSTTEKNKLIALEYLTLELASVNIDDNGLRFLEEGICLNFKDLKGLMINLMSNFQITDEGLVGFNKSIVETLQSLQSFTLAGYWWKGAKSISKDICQNLSNLKELSLMFSRIQDSLLPVISKDIKENSAHLEKLSLMLRPNQFAKPFELGKFPYLLSTTLKDLKELNLDFSGSGGQISNGIIMELGQSFEGLERLKKLALIFGECSKVGEQKKTSSDLKLGVIVPRNSSLENFEVNFKRCIGIRDEHLDDFGASLFQFQKDLRVINVNFSWCRQLTEMSYKKFCSGIKDDMEKLEDLTLDFFNCEQILKEVKAEMKVLFREVPLVNLY